MRVLRWLATAGAAAALLSPGIATANGGAYIQLDGTHFLPGDTARAEAYVYVPRAKQTLFDRGPFYAYLAPEGTAIEEGEPIPDEAIRVGSFSVERDQGKTFELAVEFTVPELPGAFYTIALCNDPCTISGFREPLTGPVSIVATAREGELLTERSELQTRLFRARHEARKAGKSIEEIEAQLGQSNEDNRSLSVMVNDLRDRLAAAETEPRRPVSSDPGRPLLDGWAAAIIATTVVAIAAGFVVRRRRPRIAMPQTP
jgi:hypothetical protein